MGKSQLGLSVDSRLPVEMTDYTCFSSLFINGAFMGSRNNRNVPSGDDLVTARAHVVCSWNVGRKNRTAKWLPCILCIVFSSLYVEFLEIIIIIQWCCKISKVCAFNTRLLNIPDLTLARLFLVRRHDSLIKKAERSSSLWTWTTFCWSESALYYVLEHLTNIFN